MLVLTRKVGESIHVGDTIQVKVVELNGSSVKLGIEAPRDVDVHREEIYERIKREQQQPRLLTDDQAFPLLAHRQIAGTGNPRR